MFVEQNIPDVSVQHKALISSKKPVSLHKRLRKGETVIQTFLFLSASASVAIIIIIGIYLSGETIEFLNSYAWSSARVITTGGTNSPVTTAQNISATETTIAVPTGYGLVLGTSSLIRLDNEIMLIVAISSDGTTIFVQRGIEGTTPLPHNTGTIVEIGKHISLIEMLTGTEWQPTLGKFGMLL